MRLALSQIRRDGGTFSRMRLSGQVVSEYAQAMQQGYLFSPVVVFYDGTDYWLADGFHRVEAAREAGFRELEVDLKLGSQRDALLHAVGANATHGLKRTPADKRHVVQLLLEDAEWGQWSDRAIAKVTATSHTFVAKVRFYVTGNISSERVYVTKHGTVATMDISRIGSSRPAAPSSSPRWLGLDPGLSRLRWAVLEAGAAQEALLLDYGEIETAKNRPTSERLWELEQDLVVLLREFQPTEIALEMPLLNNFYKATTGMLEAVGVIELVCFREKGLVPIHLYPAMWKSNLVDRRAEPEEVHETLSMLFDLSVSSSQRLDAIGIAYAAFCGISSDG